MISTRKNAIGQLAVAAALVGAVYGISQIATPATPPAVVQCDDACRAERTVQAIARDWAQCESDACFRQQAELRSGIYHTVRQCLAHPEDQREVCGRMRREAEAATDR